MSPSKTKNSGASVRQRLLNYARSSGQDFIFVLRTFAMESLLYRQSRSPYVENFVLKGAMLFKLYRPEISIARLVTLMCLHLSHKLLIL